jgi:dihydrofolate reductase
VAEISKVTIHMVSSLDGFIAKKDDSVSWLESSDNYEKGVPDATAEDMVGAIDCFVLGSRTYELALKLGWPYGEIPTVVVTHRRLKPYAKSVDFYSGDLTELFNDQLRPKFKNIWVVGGATVIRDVIRLKLVDDIRMSVMPIILGDGLPFFDYIGQEQRLHLKDVTAYQTGVVELWYEFQLET